ncbi:serine hydrolase domain-containing protein [Aquimarina brevivitae]|uniref:CubicO group peptidase (Beta-lactamase class C family) n=1 Tax=Aquimarina brevivitae TaxID=323412 RepID=A0A4Q7P528_9FLAO|nr:serine hydrolase domain-containing protein [Aquimarina brevivitae]RZS93812.1 CubicO group peptidase (beta-lactamase class C family) [Aquimarina brevivitae]
MNKIISAIIVLLIGSYAIGQDKSAAIENYLDRAHQLNRFSGAVLVQKGEQVLLKKAYGIAKLDQQINNTVATKFNIGSITKQFTATAILKLYQDGKLELHHPINTYLGKFASNRWRKVTVHHLLSHQSGIPSILQSGQGLDEYWPRETSISWDEQIAYFKDLKLINTPGEEYMYNNTGYILLALIIEQVTQIPYHQFMEEYVFKANKLYATTVSKKGDLIADNHFCYDPTEMEKAPEYHYSWYRGAGGNYATVEDLNKWYSIIHHGNFLNQENKERLFKVYARNYGYGWVITQRNHQKLVYHDGTDFGSTSFFLTVPQEDLRIIILTNQTHKELELLGESEDWVQQIGYDLLDIVNGEKIKALPKLAKSNTTYSVFNGSYAFEDGTVVSIVTKDSIAKLIHKKANLSLYRFKFYQSVGVENDEIATRAIKASEALSKRKYWKFAKYCDGEMKTVAYTGLLSIGFNQITKPIGDIKQAIVYDIKENVATARFYGTLGNVDFEIIFDKDKKIQGVFDTGYSDYLPPQTIELKQISGQRLFIDGFAIGENDAILELEEKNGITYIKLTQGDRSFLGKKLSKLSLP